MNYGEEIAYWYLRLNGFFPISNFVIHRSSKIKHTSDCDLLALRTPHVYEEIGGRPEDWDAELAKLLDFDKKIIGVICEVKTGQYSLKDIFRPMYLDYSAGRLGLLRQDQINILKDNLAIDAIINLPGDRRICKLLIANGKKRTGPFIFRMLDAAEDFIENRVRNYPKEKYADRMYFGSELFQHTIHRIHREKEQRKIGSG